jgi:hypothetical protein
MYSLIYNYGTSNFSELFYLVTNDNINIFLYFLIISFCLKLNLPGFHFLKLEIYKYMTVENIILFSTITLYFNYVFITCVFNLPFVYIILQKYKYFSLFVLIFTFIIAQKFKLNNFYEFIAYSGLITNSLIALTYII